jgi:hypothetical protein
MRAEHQRASRPEITRAAFRTVTDAARPPKAASRFIPLKASSLILSPGLFIPPGLAAVRGILARPSSAPGRSRQIYSPLGVS